MNTGDVEDICPDEGVAYARGGPRFTAKGGPGVERCPS